MLGWCRVIFINQVHGRGSRSQQRLPIRSPWDLRTGGFCQPRLIKLPHRTADQKMRPTYEIRGVSFRTRPIHRTTRFSILAGTLSVTWASSARSEGGSAGRCPAFTWSAIGIEL